MKICKARCKYCKKIIGIAALNPDDDPKVSIEFEDEWSEEIDTVSKFNMALLRNINYMSIFCSQECCDKYKEENKNG